MPKKNIHAVALGRRGGKARLTAMSAAERRRVASLGGSAKRKYRLVHWQDVDRRNPRLYTTPNHGTVLQRRDGDRWLVLSVPYDKPAREALRRLRHTR